MIFEVIAHVTSIRYGVVGDTSKGEVERSWGKISMLEDTITDRDGAFGQAVKEWRLNPENNNALAFSIHSQRKLPCNLVLKVELRKSGKEEVPFVLSVENVKS